MIRAFIAVDLNETLRREISALQTDLRSARADVKWVEPGNLHLTLKFLGSVDENHLLPLTDALKTSGLRHHPFTISLGGLGCFPNMESPRVIWIAVSAGKEDLGRLAQAMEEACVNLGFPKEERAFSPHLTIGRMRSQDRLVELVKRLRATPFRGSELAPIERLVLFQSHLSPRGSTYTPLAEIPLTPPHS